MLNRPQERVTIEQQQHALMQSCRLLVMPTQQLTPFAFESPQSIAQRCDIFKRNAISQAPRHAFIELASNREDRACEFALELSMKSIVHIDAMKQE